MNRGQPASFQAWLHMRPADGPKAADLLLLACRSGGPLIGTGSGQDTYEPNIALVAGVLEDRLRRVSQGDHQAPWFRPRPGVIDRNFVFQAFRAGAGEAFHHMKLFAGYTHKASRFVVRCIYYEGIAFPMAARVPQPLMDRRRNMRAPIE